MDILVLEIFRADKSNSPIDYDRAIILGVAAEIEVAASKCHSKGRIHKDAASISSDPLPYPFYN